MKCLYCHEVIDPSGKFCPKCGLPLNDDVTASGAALPDTGITGQWSAGGIGVKPFAALIAASAVGAIIGVSVGWMGGKTPPPSTLGQVPGAAAVTPTEPLVPPAPTAARPAASSATTVSAGLSAADLTTMAMAAQPSTGTIIPPVEVEPEGPSLLTDEEFERQYADVWAGVSPRKRYTPPPPVVNRRPDPMSPSHVLAMNPYRSRGPKFITYYWVPPTIEGVSGQDGPGPAEAASRYGSE